MTSPAIFLSYSRDDQATARWFAEGFEREGMSVWWDQSLNPGEAYDHVTEKALREARAVVVLWSKKSVDSRWVRAEATQADRSKTLVPAMIEPCTRPIMFELTQTSDLSQWKGEPGDRQWLAFVAGVRRFVDRAGSGGEVRGATPVTGRPKRGGRLAIAAGAAALLVAGAVLWMVIRPGAQQNAEPTASAVSTPTTGEQVPVSLAVLPFANLSSDPEQEYFSDGLSEEILNQLAQIKKLRVTARTSSFSFKGKNEDMRVIGEKLGVANLLEGSVRKDGNRLRITAQLIHSKDGSHQWSKTYDRELSGVFAMQEEIAKDVAQALSITLDVGDMNRAEGGTTNIEAYEKFLQARTLLFQGGRNESLRAAQLCREAVALDPQFARAWLALGRSLFSYTNWVPEDRVAAAKEADQAVTRVEQLAPHAWWAQAVRAGQFYDQRKWAEAEAAARAVVANAPMSEIEAAWVHANVLWGMGHVKEALAYFERMRETDPLSLAVSGQLQTLFDAAGRPAEAQKEYERSIDLAGNHGEWEHYALLRLMARSDADPAVVKARFREFISRETVPMALNHELLDLLDDKVAARAAIRRAFDDPAYQDWTRMAIIKLYADAFGDRDLTMAALRRAVQDLGTGEYHLWHPYVTNLRTDPRFKELVRELGLVDYWRSSGNWGDYCKPVGVDDFECH